MPKKTSLNSKKSPSPKTKVLSPVDQLDPKRWQSVRTSFRLTRSADNALKWLAKHDSITSKDVFQYLFNWMAALLLLGDHRDNQDDMFSIDREFNPLTSEQSTRKTLVISKIALSTINDISKKHQISRDSLVNQCLLSLKLFREKQLKKEKKENKKALKVISQFISKAEDVERQLKTILEESSPILSRFARGVAILGNLQSVIEANLQKETEIDPEDIYQI